ncbi:MAG: type III-A CRISPR-associated protein Csm2 [Polaromonas sp.]
MATNYGGTRQTGWGNDRQAAPRPTISVSDITLASPIPVNLFSEIAQDKAAKVHEAGDGRKNKSTQLRRFYDELVMWFDKVQAERTKETRASKYTEVAPFIKMMNAKVAYARGRDHVDECFEQMFSHLIRQISDADSLKHAKLFMEAFMGFYKAQEK